MKIFDSHCHLYLEDFKEDLDEVVRRARDAGVKRLVNIGIDVSSSRSAITLALENPGFYASAGFHPHDAVDFSPSDLDELKALAEKKEILAVGEIGLDFYRLRSPKEVQERVFNELLEIAEETLKPVIIHTREAFLETFKILAARRSALKGILIHCFTGTSEEAGKYLDLGAFLSVPGVVTYKNAGELKKALKHVPRDRVLIETDAPYLAPVPFRGKRNEPSYLVRHLEAIAGIWEIEPREAAEITFENASRFFGLDA
ncbi:MAG: TatD family hydrolase [Deltaproteobacteria bacterium]|jgi:TatD DNase family protein|nr:TatD family hydrolase [Deltaproteobacteria bacterium]